MDILIYIGIALAVGVVLFFVFGGKRSASVAPRELEEDRRAGASLKEQADSTEFASAEQDPDESKPGALKQETDKEKAEAPGVAEPYSSPQGQPSSPSQDAARPQRDLSSLRKGLARSREAEGFFGKLKSLFSSKAEISSEIAEDIEEILLASDVGVATTTTVLEKIRDQLSKGELADEAAVWSALRQEAATLLSVDGTSGAIKTPNKPTVILLVGVNGAGKTTTIGKLATQLKSQGKSCVLAAGDTFRAAAVQQLVVWGQRVGCEVVRGKDGSDPGSVIFDAIKKAEELGADVVLADTAGRLHTKSNLMAEMQKIARTASKALAGAPHETLLVIDSTNGQNAMAQAKEFKEALALSGVVLTKLDGTAKGGVVLGIADALRLPVRYVGLGERSDDLHEFVPDDFVEALLGKDE